MMLTSHAAHLLSLSLALALLPAQSPRPPARALTSVQTHTQSRPPQTASRPQANADAEKAARQTHERASELARQGRYDEAIALEEQARREMAAAVGTDDLKYGVVLNDLASLYLQKGDFVRAEQAFKELVALADRLSATDPSLAGTARNNLGVVYMQQGKLDLAAAELEQARRTRERVLGAEHPEVGVTLNYLGEVQYRRGEFTDAERTYERALALLNRGADDYQLFIAIAENNLALALVRMGRLDRAVETFERVIATHRRLGGEINPEVATALNNLAAVYEYKGDHANAERVYKQALDILGKLWGASHVAIALTLVNLAAVYRARAEYAESEKALLRALEIYKNAPAADPDSVAIAKNDLGMVYRAVGRVAESRSLFNEVLSFFEKTYGPRNLKTATVLNNLALLSQDAGEYDAARELFRRVIDIYEKSDGVDPVLFATALQNRASLDLIFDDYASASRGLEQARGLLARVHGADHPLTATLLNNQAVVAEARGDYASAIRLYEQALDLRTRLLPPSHPDIAGTLNNLGLLKYRNGDYPQAERLTRRAIKIYEEAGLGAHPDFGLILGNLAFVLLAQGNAGEAVRVMARTTDITERHLSRLTAVGSSAQKRLYAESLLTETSGVLTLHLGLAPNNVGAARLALTTALRRKGRVLDAMKDQAASLRRRLRPQELALFERLQSVYGRLSALTGPEGPQASTPQPREEVVRLEAEAARLEELLSASYAELGSQLQPVTLARVRQALPADSALVEFVWYRPLDVKARKDADRFGVPRYAAYVLRREGEPGFVDLGQAPLIELLLFRLRAALRDPRRDDAKQLARLLDKSLMQPVRGLLGGESRIFVSPDGALNLVPFGAFVDEQNRYLLERYEFAYLTSGRDLLRGDSPSPARQPPLVVANPLFGDGSTGEGPGKAVQNKFGPLNGTEEEARQVGRLLKVAPLTGGRATEGALRGASGPVILHIATHGYFLPYQEPEPKTAEGFNPLRSLSQFRAVEEHKSPLLRSGLAFAGANRPDKAESEDGILTALEASGLDLWGTKLVVLSACETGLGDVQLGEGVYGLRRSFMLAGAESAVMSFWKVEDEVTRDMMVQYYKRLLDGEGRSEALRQVQLKVLADASRSHPFYWASFIHLGNWRSLGGQGPARW